MNKHTYIIGDVHGKVTELIQCLNDAKINSSTIICVGDFGLGFIIPEQLNVLQHQLAADNNLIITIRGNHDNPYYFVLSTNRHIRMNLIAVGDYTQMYIPGLGKTLFIGGGYSLDKAYRKEGVDYWQEELPKFSSIPESHYHDSETVITHCAPTEYIPMQFKRISDTMPNDVRDDIKHTKQVLDLVYQELVEGNPQPPKWYFGHYHTSYIGENYRCLNELELIQIQ